MFAHVFYWELLMHISWGQQDPYHLYKHDLSTICSGWNIRQFAPRDRRGFLRAKQEHHLLRVTTPCALPLFSMKYTVYIYLIQNTFIVLLLLYNTIHLLLLLTINWYSKIVKHEYKYYIGIHTWVQVSNMTVLIKRVSMYTCTT